jgi:UDP-galactose transporter B1
LLLESLMVASGHFFAYYLIAHFKQHVVPFVITTRKALSVLLSIVVYGHQVNAKQWVGIVLVFGGVLGELAWGWGKRLWWRYRQPLRYSII